jgi:hypothetical protein
MAAFDWADFFHRVSRQLQADLDSICPPSGQLPMQDVRAIRSTAVSFCDAVKLCLIASPSKFYTLVIFCLSPNPVRRGVQFLGVLSTAEAVSALTEIPADDHGLIRGLSGFLRWHQPSDIIVQFRPGDISTIEKEYTTELLKILLEPFDGIFQKRLSAKLDFNAKYGLSATAAVDPLSLCGKIDIRTSAFFLDFGITRQPLIDQWQNLIVHIALLPQTTGFVKSTFEIARKLFVFSLFEYEFATVSAHYAGLALESAIYNRWNLTLPQRGVTVEHQCSKNPGTLTAQMPTYRAIADVCKEKNWKRKVLVEGRIFPRGMNKVLEDLENFAIISAWQRRRIDFCLQNLRHPLSHLEFKPLHPPNPKVLAIVAEIINQLFDSVPLSAAVRGWGSPQF